jgi:hypothetical protein
MVENQTNKKIKILCSDNGGEYKSYIEVDVFCQIYGIRTW